MDRNQVPTAAALRDRLSAWARYVFRKNRYASVYAMAKDMGHNQGALNDIINGKGTTGLEFAIKLALAGRESLDTICLRDPAQEYFRPGPPTTIAEAPPPPPRPASGEPHQPQPRKRKSGGHR